MITRDKNHLTKLLNQLKEEEIKQSMNYDCVSIAFYLNCYNRPTVEPWPCWCPYYEEEIESKGGLIIEKDEFLDIFINSDSINTFLLYEVIKTVAI